MNFVLPNPFESFKKKVFTNTTNWKQKIKYGYSMLSEERMNNIYHTLTSVIQNRIPGDFVETGVWKGGSCMFAQFVLKQYAETHRKIWVCDSFEGFPATTDLDEKYKKDWQKLNHFIAISLEEVKKNFETFNLLDPNVKFVKGFFENTIPTLPVEKIAILRLDGDMYKSTMDVLIHLYHKVQPGGFVIIDDYGPSIPSCVDAVHDFRNQHNIQDEIIKFKDTPGHGCAGAFWQIR